MLNLLLQYLRKSFSCSSSPYSAVFDFHYLTNFLKKLCISFFKDVGQYFFAKNPQNSLETLRQTVCYPKILELQLKPSTPSRSQEFCNWLIKKISQRKQTKKLFASVDWFQYLFCSLNYVLGIRMLLTNVFTNVLFERRCLGGVGAFWCFLDAWGAWFLAS